MSDKATVFQKGGGGTNYEQAVETAFTITMLINGNVPCLPTGVKIIEIAFQTTNKGYETDDILVIAKSTTKQYRLIIQVKHNLIFSCKNDVFKQVITGFWNDFNKSAIFDKNIDRLLIIKSGLNNTERNHIKLLLNIAKTHQTESDFFTEINHIQIMKEKFVLFIDTLKDIDKTITESNVWEFIKCLEVLDYDFLSEPSSDKIYFLNIIKLSKNKIIPLNEEEIWNTILAFVSQLNHTGGNITNESLRESNLHSYFALENIIPYYSSITKLVDNGDIFMKMFKNNIDGYHIPREKYYEKIVNALQENKIIFITGEPGVGKSAIVKDFIYKMFGNKGFLSFKADQFNVMHLATLLSNQGINISFRELLSCVALMESKIIFIDGMEKLLEGDPLNAFQQLKSIIAEYPGIKIIVTARRFSIELLCQKYDINPENVSFVAIEQLSKEELERVSSEFPKLKPVLQNNKINTLLSSPKYIEFALTALKKANENFTDINQIEFKSILWNRLVKNDLDRTDGLPQKREDVFIGIAVKRAKSMQMFIRPIDADPAVVNLLETDNIIIQDDSSGTYSPAHDILEDWALTYYVSRMFDNYPSPHELFTRLGNEPAVRRGFRLWVNEKLSSSINSISGLVNTALNDPSIEKYWSDELLVALLKSENCDTFVSEYKEILLSNNFALLRKCIHFIRIACKENLYEDGQFQILIPEGKIWGTIIIFIEQNISMLDAIRLSIIGLLSDWEIAFILNKLHNKEIEISVRNIVIFYINQIETGNFDFLKRDERHNIFMRLISILYNLAEVSGEYITELIKRAWEYKENQNKYELLVFYNIIIENCLSGEFPGSKLVRHMPDLVIDVAWKEWKMNPEEYTSFEEFNGIPIQRPLNDFKVWGIQNEMRFSPAGIYKTPFYYMLMTNPLKAINFIVAFLNYSTEFYVNSHTSEYKHNLSQIDIVLNDGSIIKQWGGDAFWLAYRGLSVINNLTESLLLSVEKYLLECASRNSPTTKNIVNYFSDYIFRNSNNIMLTSIIASVSIAFPEVVEESMLPLLRVKEFYFFDLSRAANERSALSPMDNKIQYAQIERHKFNQLPHRTKYARGLMDFIVDYQISIKTINDKIFHVFDDLKSKDDKSDELWTKTLNEIDIRNYYMKDYNDNLGGYPLAVKYDASLDKHLAEGNNLVKNHEETLRITKIVDDAYKTEGIIEYSQWLDCYNHYTNTETSNNIFNKCATLAIIGLRDLESSLKNKQKKWCIIFLLQSIKEIVFREMNSAYLLETSFSMLEEDVILSSLHYILKATNNKKKKQEKLQLFVLLICNISAYKAKTLITYMRNTFSNVCYDNFTLILTCLIRYSHFLNKNKEKYYRAHIEGIDKLRKEESDFIRSIIKSNDLKLNTELVKFDHFNHHILCRALTIIPFDEISKNYLPFMKDILEKIINYLNKEDIYEQKSFFSHPNRDRLNIYELLLIHSFTADIILSSSIELSKQIIDILLSIPLSTERIQEETEEFISQILNQMALKLADEGNENPNSLSYTTHFSRFWDIWEYVFNTLKDRPFNFISNKLLLDISCLCYDVYGQPYKNQCDLLKGKKNLYGKIVSIFGKRDILTVIGIFTNIGMPSLFPDCINWIVDICKKTDDVIQFLNTNISITMVKKLFYQHMTDIARDEYILSNYIWLLDTMIDLGVSEAYYLRENVITFKKTTRDGG